LFFLTFGSHFNLEIDILGSYGKVDEELVKKIWVGNPLGQAGEQTPFGLIRPVQS